MNSEDKLKRYNEYLHALSTCAMEGNEKAKVTLLFMNNQLGAHTALNCNSIDELMNKAEKWHKQKFGRMNRQ